MEIGTISSQDSVTATVQVQIKALDMRAHYCACMHAHMHVFNITLRYGAGKNENARDSDLHIPCVIKKSRIRTHMCARLTMKIINFPNFYRSCLYLFGVVYHLAQSTFLL